MTDMQFTLTFNKPAFKMFFEGEEAQGLKIRVQDGMVQFRPVASDQGADTARLEQRERGGLAASIEGDASSTILEHLKNPNGLPYFMLSRAAKGWITATPFEGPGREPPRFHPQVRVWVKNSARPLPLHLIHDVRKMDVANFVQELRDAKNLIDKHSQLKKIGRPPAEVTAARDKIKLFADVARDVLPLTGLWRAYLALGRYLGANPIVPSHFDLSDDELNPFGPPDEAHEEEKPEPKRTAAKSLPKVAAPEPAPEPAKRGRKPRNKDDDAVTVVTSKPKVDAEAERLASEAQAKLGLKDDDDKNYQPPIKRSKTTKSVDEDHAEQLAPKRRRRA